jgi:hypothetical protein
MFLSLISATLAAVGVLAASAQPALAATSARSVGTNIGQLLESWARPIFLGVLALFAIPHLLKRDVAGGVVFAMIALLVGFFVLYGSGVERFIVLAAKAIFG